MIPKFLWFPLELIPTIYAIKKPHKPRIEKGGDLLGKARAQIHVMNKTI